MVNNCINLIVGKRKETLNDTRRSGEQMPDEIVGRDSREPSLRDFFYLLSCNAVQKSHFIMHQLSLSSSMNFAEKFYFLSIDFSKSKI